MEKKGRIDYLDIAKGIAILAVILGHCGGLPQGLINFIFSFHMPVFFFISGFVLKPRDSREYAVRKAKQLMIPYYMTGLSIIVLSTIQLCIKHAFIDDIYTDILNKIWAVFYGSGEAYQTSVYIPNAQALWFFPALFVASIIVNECIKRKYSAVYIGCIAVLGYYTSKIFWLPLSLQAGMVSAVYVYIGFEFKKYNILDFLDRKIVAIEIFAIYILYYIWGGGRLYLVRNWFEQGIWEVIGSICAILCVIQVSKVISDKIKPCKKLFSFLGKNTQFILCFHIIDLFLFDWGFLYGKLSPYGNFVLFGALFLLRSLWAVGGMLIFRYIQSALKNISRKFLYRKIPNDEITIPGVKKRNMHIDVVKGLAILLMVYAHYPIDESVSGIIFSFHMPVFIILSGYFCNRNTKMKDTFLKVGRGLLLPYAAASCTYAFLSSWYYMTHTDISVVSGNEAINIFLQKMYFALWGVSVTSTKFQNIESVGPIWFIVCLALVRLIYVMIEKLIKNDKILCIVIAGISVSGYCIGKFYAYLPWSLDVAMVILPFFHLGYLMKQKKMETFKMQWLCGLFLIWILSVHYGGLDLASRKYAYFPLCIAGAAAGSLLVIKGCGYLMQIKIIKDCLSFCGRHSMLILCIHSMEQRICYWQGILPNMSENIVFLFRIMLIMMFTILFLCFKIIYAENIGRLQNKITGRERKEFTNEASYH